MSLLNEIKESNKWFNKFIQSQKLNITVNISDLYKYIE